MQETGREIPHIKDIMKLRMKMKADKTFAQAIKSAIHKVCADNGVDVSQDAVNVTILVHPEEVATTESVGSLPVGSQCQAF